MPIVTIVPIGPNDRIWQIYNATQPRSTDTRNNLSARLFQHKRSSLVPKHAVRGAHVLNCERGAAVHVPRIVRVTLRPHREHTEKTQRTHSEKAKLLRTRTQSFWVDCWLILDDFWSD